MERVSTVRHVRSFQAYELNFALSTDQLDLYSVYALFRPFAQPITYRRSESSVEEMSHTLLKRTTKIGLF